MLRLILAIAIAGNYTMSFYGITHDHYPTWWFAVDALVAFIAVPQLFRA